MPLNNKTFKPFETIVFDLDGTLIDSSITIIHAFNYALKPYGMSISAEEVESMRSMTDKELFMDRLSPTEAKEALARLWEYSNQSAGETILLDGVKPLIQKIADCNITLGLWTGRDTASATNILKTHGIFDYFHGVVGGCHVKKNKPDAEGLLLLAEKLNSSLKTMIHIGDHEHDLIGASSVGVKVAHAKWCTKIQDKSAIIHPLANFTFHSIHEFNLWLDENFSK